MKSKFLKIVYAGLVLFISSVANAGLIYDNGSANGNGNRCSETSSACGGPWTLFDDFVVSNDSTVNSVSWTVLLDSGINDYNFASISFYDADPVLAGGTLLNSFASFGIVQSSTLGGNWFDITMGGLALDLTSGTYWLGFQHNTTNGVALVGESNRVGNTTQWQNSGSGVRHGGFYELAFRVEGELTSVPEPSTLAIFALGMIGLASRRFKKQS